MNTYRGFHVGAVMMPLFFRSFFFLIGGLLFWIGFDQIAGIFTADVAPSFLAISVVLVKVAILLSGGLLALYVAKLGGELSTDEAVLRVLGWMTYFPKRLIRFLGTDGVLVVFAISFTGAAVFGEINDERTQGTTTMVALIACSTRALKRLRDHTLLTTSGTRAPQTLITERSVLLITAFAIILGISLFLDFRILYWTQYVLGLALVLVLGSDIRQTLRQGPMVGADTAEDPSVSIEDAELLADMQMAAEVADDAVQTLSAP